MDVGWITAASEAQIPLGDRERIAFSLEGEERITYGGLAVLQNRYANALLELGVGRGDRVGVLMLNSLDYLALYFAIARIGAVAVRLNTRLTAAELRFALEDSETSVLCGHAELLRRIEPLRGELGVREYVAFGAAERPLWARDGADFLRSSDAEPPVERPRGADPQVLMYTSGTTGFPKGAVWTHETTLGCLVAQALELRLDAATVMMTTGPLYHAGALEALLLPTLMRRGRAIATRSGGFEIERVVGVIAAEGVTDIMLYPFMLYDLMRLPGIDAERLPSLRGIFTGGDAILTWALEAAQERFPEVQIRQGYGLTEATQSTFLDHEAGRRHPDSIGRPFPLKEVKVVDEQGDETAAEEPGEILIRGPGTTAGYWRRPQESAATYADGWLHTGDIGRVSDGLLFLAGRKKDMIRSGGENISPAEVEKALVAHPSIADAALVAVPDPKYLEVGCAVIVLAPAAAIDDAEVIAHCREHLAGYKCPKHVLRVEELPRNGSGKVLKHELRERCRPLGEEPATVD
ncbi:MAG: AMP-binding protein [Actinobacteria bacterium]|nr:AMP-binding protein [Actinomycetota bacterium]